MAVNKKSLKNLKKFKKNDPRTKRLAKNGKRGISIIASIKKHFEDGTVSLPLISKGICVAMAKNPAMARLVMEYIDGKVPEKPVENEKYIVVSPEIMAMMNKKKD